jgi:hypothetical protein
MGEKRENMFILIKSGRWKVSSLRKSPRSRNAKPTHNGTASFGGLIDVEQLPAVACKKTTFNPEKV